MKLSVSILVMAGVDAQNARRRGNKNDEAAAPAADTSYDSYGFEGYEYSFGTAGSDPFAGYDSYGSYGGDDGFANYNSYDSYADNSYGDLSAEVPDESIFEAYEYEAPSAPLAVEAVEVPAEPVAAPAEPAAAPAASRPVHTSSSGKQFQADGADRPGGASTVAAEVKTAEDGQCLTGVAKAVGGFFSGAEIAGLTLQNCHGDDLANSDGDFRDYCLVEIRTVGNQYVQFEGRCTTADDCDSALTNNFQFPTGVPSAHDQCRAQFQDDDGNSSWEATNLQTGRFAAKESICRVCSHQNSATRGSGKNQVTVTANTVTISDDATNSLTDLNGKTDLKEWSRRMWKQTGLAATSTFQTEVIYAKQEAGK